MPGVTGSQPYWQQGTPVPRDQLKSEESVCNKPDCTPTSGFADDDRWDTEGDAQQGWANNAQGYLDKLVPAAWKSSWDKFKCTNKDCLKKQGCEDTPIFIAAGAVPIEVPDPTVPRKAKWRWEIRVMIERKIRCVRDDGKPAEDSVPKIPQIPKDKPPFTEPTGESHLSKPI